MGNIQCEVIGDCTMYCADAYEILPTLTGIQYIVTDPPWSIAETSILRPGAGQEGRRVHHTLPSQALGGWSCHAVELCESCCSGDILIFSGFRELGHVIQSCQHYRATFVWQKPNAAPTISFPARMDTSFIVWTAKQSSLYGYEHWPSMVFRISGASAGFDARERFLNDVGKALHPAQGPLALYTMLLAPFPRGLILDPFMGTGTTAAACVELGHSFIGVEINPCYFDIACCRIKQAYTQLPLFSREETRPVQQKLFAGRT